jgi:hypothetical protein
MMSIEDFAVTAGKDVAVPVIIESPGPLTALGADISYPAGVLDFIRFEKTDFSEGFVQFEVFEVSPGILRMGGYRVGSSEGSPSATPAVMAILVFKTKSFVKRKALGAVRIIGTVDGLRGLSVRNGTILNEGAKENPLGPGKNKKNKSA